MNSMQNQNTFNAQQNFQQPYQQGFQQQNQANKYQPTGYVQSHYQGQISQQNAGPVISRLGYQANQQQANQQQGFGQQAQGQMNSFAGAQNQQQPVISHVGYQVGQDYYPRAIQQQNAGFAQQSMQAQAGAHTPQNPVYQATGAQQQAGPVISHVGYQAGNQNFGSQQQGQFSNQNQQAQFSSNMQQQAQAHTPQNPVYQATGAQQQAGPVISRVGYQAGNQQAQQGFGFQNNMNR